MAAEEYRNFAILDSEAPLRGGAGQCPLPIGTMPPGFCDLLTVSDSIAD
jgi:hypothetical protein